MPRQIVVDGQVVGTAPDDATDDELAALAEELAAPVGRGASGSWDAPDTRSATQRFLAPVGGAIKGLAGLPAAAAKILFQPSGAREVVGALAEPQFEQGREAVAAAREGRTLDAVGRGVAAAVPFFGPAGADMVDTAAEGDLAGAAGQAFVNIAPAALPRLTPRAAQPTRAARASEAGEALSKQPFSVAGALRKRAAARMLDIMDPTPARKTTAREIALEVVEGTDNRKTPPKAGGVGHGSLDDLTARAEARRASAGKTVGELRHLDTPVKPAGVIDDLRRRADDLESKPPDRIDYEEVDTGLLDEAGEPIMGIKQQKRKGTPDSEYEELVAAYRARAAKLERFAAQYPDAAPPAGELFRRRAGLGRKYGKSFERMPGNEPAAAATAGRDTRGLLGDLLHREIPASKIADREYRVWKNAATNLKNAGLRNTRGLQGLMQLLKGRLAGMGIGAVSGLVSGSGAGLPGAALGGLTGAIAGVALGESVRWGSFRAHNYAKLARLLNEGHIDEAAEYAQRVSLAAAAQDAVRQREREREAERALRTQAEGVVAP